MKQGSTARRFGISRKIALGCAFVAAVLLSFAATALAGPPNHPRAAGLDIEGLNHACGVAVDSKGDVYASSAGESKIKVFGPTHAFLTSIPDASEPCGLAVNSKGELFVAERGVGKVVRYKPNSYPFVGTPSYGAAEPIDSSGTAKGLAIDRFDDRLYVAAGSDVAVYEADGTSAATDEVQKLSRSASGAGTFRLALPGEGGPSRNEVQKVEDAICTGGTFTLSFEGEDTTPLECHANAAEVQSGLEALPAIGAGNLKVAHADGLEGRLPWWVEFKGALALTDVPLLEGDFDGLESGAQRNPHEVQVEALSDVSPQLPFSLSKAELEAALVGLEGIEPGEIEVEESGSAFLVTFVGGLGDLDVEALRVDSTALGAETFVNLTEQTKGFSGIVGNGKLTGASGVAAYTYVGTNGATSRSVYVADASTNDVLVFGAESYKTLEFRKAISGPEAGEDFGFGNAGAYLAVDPGNRGPEEKCASVAEQACTAGHLLVYDDSHQAVDEFDAAGRLLDRFGSAALTDAEPTAMAIERSGTASDGAIYVSSGAGAGAKVLAFGPLAAPSRAALPERPPSRVLPTATGVATDTHGDVYVLAGSLIHVYAPSGEELAVGPSGKGIEDPNSPRQLAVDSDGRVYVLDTIEIPIPGGGFTPFLEVTYYTPSAFPPQPGTAYVRHESPIAAGNSEGKKEWPEHCYHPETIGINLANDHLFVSAGCEIHEYDSADPGHDSALIDPEFAAGIEFGGAQTLAVDSTTGNVYVANGGNQSLVTVVDPSGTEALARINGAGSPNGLFGNSPRIAVDQSNGNLIEFQNPDGAAREYDSSGAFVTEFAFPEPLGFTKELNRTSSVAIDNSGGPTDGRVYVAFDDAKKNTPDLWAFGPLAYGEPPLAETGGADELGAGNATLHGTVNPRGFELTECQFEYLTDDQYLSNGKGFAGATSVPCAESLAAIGKGGEPVGVHAQLAGLNPEARYRFRLVAANKYGPSKGDAGLFGPPRLKSRPALPLLYTEATLRGEIDPSGLSTRYWFEYGTSESYGETTQASELAPGDGFVAVHADLLGLAEGTTYHFRLVAENETMQISGPDQAFTTLVRRSAESCGNLEFRTGFSTNLPDCRAYELVSPAETGGVVPSALDPINATAGFNAWLTVPRGPHAGERTSFFTGGTLPGFEGNGMLDGYRAERAAGPHPEAGWTSTVFGPTFAQATPDINHPLSQQSGASDQLFSFWVVHPSEPLSSTLEDGIYLRTPTGFEPVGEGELGADLHAESRYVSPGGAHVIFSSSAHLEEGAPEAGTMAVYDRAAGSSSARVVSLLPGDLTPAPGQDAHYRASTEDGSTVVFDLGGALYARRNGEETVEVAGSPHTFAGISEDGSRVFYVAGTASRAPAPLRVCDLAGGSCAGPEATQEPIQIAGGGMFSGVSADGSDALFVSEEALTGTEENEAGEIAEAGEDNLYAWDAATDQAIFVAQVAAQDLVSFQENAQASLVSWTSAIDPATQSGRADATVRSTPDGGVFLFQSHASLTGYESEGRSEIYRFDPAAGQGERLLCMSCAPGGAPAESDAVLQDLKSQSAKTVIPNLTDDGALVFFESGDRLLPEDANGAVDVYEWRAAGSAGCNRPGGCLALISTGQGEGGSHLYAMSADGHDVFFRTKERLVGRDVVGTASIYDARVEGGIPDPQLEQPCQGDSCQGEGATPPSLPPPTSSGGGEGNLPGGGSTKVHCPKGRHAVRRAGKVRCVKVHNHQHRRHHKHRANSNRRAGR